MKLNQTENDLFTWGNNKHGQLGLGSRKTELFPQKVNLNKCVEPICCITSGRDCSLYVTLSGLAYATGSNR